MTGLIELWLLSLLLAGSSLLIMSGLVGARVIFERRQERLQFHRERLTHEILQSLQHGNAEAPELSISPRDLPLVSELSRDFLTLVTGEDRKRLTQLFSRLGVAPFLRYQLAKGPVGAAMDAADCLLHFPGAATRAALAGALSHRSGRVRLAAAMSLSKLDPAFPVDVLMAQLRIGTQEQSRLAVDLFRNLAPRQKDRILRIAQEETASFSTRAMALEALASTGDYSLVAPLVSLALGGGAELKAKTLECLGLIGHPAARPAVAPALRDEHWLVRERAAVAAGLIGLGDLADELKRLLRDHIWSVRFQAGEALLKLGKPGIAKLIEARQSGDEVERHTAALTLAEQGLT